MKITPTQKFLLVRMDDAAQLDQIGLPEGTYAEPYGDVILCGPDCTFIKVGDKVAFNPQNIIAGFDKGGDERMIIPESAVIAYIDPEHDQVGQKRFSVVESEKQE